MCGGGGGKAQKATYTSRDGMVFDDPNQAADRDRQLQLAAAFGYDKSAIENQFKAPVGGTTGNVMVDAAVEALRKQQFTDPFEAWKSAASGDFKTYNDQGLTAADYRAEQRLKEQEAQARAAEEQRKASIAQSRGAIDTAFGAFDDNYFGNISKTVSDYYTPQIEDQFNDANKQLTYKFARQGNTKSTAYGDEQAKLRKQYDVQRAGITNQASDAASSARENVSAAKSKLYNYAESAADPAAVNDQLASETARVRANVPQLTPLGQVFSDYLSPIISSVGTGLAAEARGYPGFRTGLFDNNSSRYKVVN